MTDLYAERDVTPIHYQDLKAIRECNIEKLVLCYEMHGRKYHKDYGLLCFSLNKKPTCKSSSKVVLNSIKESRKKALKSFIIYILNENLSIQTIKSYIAQLNSFFTFINKFYPDLNFNNPNELYKLYRDYTNYLLARVASTSGKPFKQNTANSLQTICARLISIHLETDIENIYVRAKRIFENRIDTKVWSASEYSLDLFFLYNLSIFRAIKNFLIGKLQLPLHFNFSFPDHHVIADFEFKGYMMRKKIGKDLDINLDFLGNKAIAAFMYCFASVTGANLSSLKKIQVDKFEIVPSTKGYRTYTTKKRSGGCEVPIEFSAEFVSTFNEFKSFREWILDQYSDNFKRSNQNNLFFYLPVRTLKPNSFKEMLEITNNSLNSYKFWVTENFDINWINLRGVRQLVSTEMLKFTNSVRLASLKLGNNTTTFNKNYGKTTFDDSANELSNALDSIFKSCIYPKTNSIECIPTPIANCANVDKKKIQLLNFDIEPDCNKPETCLFCANLVLHIDKEDIRKLLSVLEMFQTSKLKVSEQALQIQERIHNLLDEMQIKFPETTAIIDSVRVEVEEGEIDGYWADISITLSILEQL
ncbi:hypothetical protein [Acinetobacter sp. PK01]|uniref:hypothetical protein n=1 Tax=Acinetobacter sp. PK01 TaxID=2930198 RepID=UPI001FB5B1B0|nr:hypothetical protein [Acinetobacter sp. PK01]UOG18356.1 hypothetical protein MP622_01645 [Acinetobacter sp. PK01]